MKRKEVVFLGEPLVKQFLEKKKLWNKYWKYVKKFKGEEDYEQFKDTIYAIDSCFFWDDTEEQFYFWENINKRYKAWFRKIYKQNNKDDNFDEKF